MHDWHFRAAERIWLVGSSLIDIPWRAGKARLISDMKNRLLDQILTLLSVVHILPKPGYATSSS